MRCNNNACLVSPQMVTSATTDSGNRPQKDSEELVTGSGKITGSCCGLIRRRPSSHPKPGKLTTPVPGCSGSGSLNRAPEMRYALFHTTTGDP